MVSLNRVLHQDDNQLCDQRGVALERRGMGVDARRDSEALHGAAGAVAGGLDDSAEFQTMGE